VEKGLKSCSFATSQLVLAPGDHVNDEDPARGKKRKQPECRSLKKNRAHINPEQASTSKPNGGKMGGLAVKMTRRQSLRGLNPGESIVPPNPEGIAST